MDQIQVTNAENQEKLSFDRFRDEVLNDYRVCCESREASLLGRKEVLTGKAKFGIFGDGKEVIQVAMAKFFKEGDFRSGYYRDQTFVFATGMATVENFFSQLYADPNIEHDVFSAGRQMNGHYGTRLLDEKGDFLDLVNRKNSSSDISPTAGQTLRALGLAYASKYFRSLEDTSEFSHLTRNGNEVCFCTIGDASTSEGHFWETMNAAGVLQVPLAMFVYDDGFGISVPKAYQTTKSSISEALSGMQQAGGSNGINIYKLKGWDYAGICETLEYAIEQIRTTHTPALFHVEEVTQPQGHSTSGSHERYKTPERLQWEKEWDGITKMREWILSNALAAEEELEVIENNAVQFVRESKQRAWEKYSHPIREMVDYSLSLLEHFSSIAAIQNGISELKSMREPMRRDVMRVLAESIRHLKQEQNGPAEAIRNYYKELKLTLENKYNSKLYCDDGKSALQVAGTVARFDAQGTQLNGFEVLNQYFDALFSSRKDVLAFGEDLGHIGDVNQGFSGLQAKYGLHRIFDTGIRELTIMGQGIGMAIRGLRPIAEIQYLDYLLYGLQPLSDDAATIHYRSAGQQCAPLIVRTRGHRLEGVWHSGSPMGTIIHALRGMHICVPRNMTQAVGMYNTLLQGNEPGLVVECLNGYRLKEQLISNLLEYSIPLGVPEILQEGTDITIVSYGSTLRIIQDAMMRLEQSGISCELIDVQTLLPFDRRHMILESLKKTNRILFVDEDVPGGASAYMFNHVMEIQGGYRYLDVAPRTLAAKAHRPAYGSDGDYFSKPNAEDVIQVITEMMSE